MTRSHLRKQFGELTKNTFESVPLWWVKGPGVLAADLDERSCKPEFREQIVDLVSRIASSSRSCCSPVVVKNLPLGADKGEVEGNRRSWLHLYRDRSNRIDIDYWHRKVLYTPVPRPPGDPSIQSTYRFGCFKPFYGRLRQAIQDYPRPSKTNRDHPRPTETIRDCPRPSEYHRK